MRFRSLAPLAALVALPLMASAQEHQHGGNDHAKMEHPVTVVILVRHAEKAAEPANDPPLTAVGQERARALAALLGDAKVGAVLHTPTARTRDTALPVAERFGLTPEVVRPGADAVAEAVRKHPGKTVVVVGHSNTVMAYIAALGGPQRPALCDHQYDGLYTLVIAHGEVRLVEGRYGPANPAPTQPCATMAPPASRP
jgi:broad specificity phosphatase PhoE